MKALISPLETVSTGVRIAQVVSDSGVFEVTQPLYWVDCPSDCNARTWYYNETDLQCNLIPELIPTAGQNKTTAVAYLELTDWTSIADVGNPEMANPYLTNQAEFIAWRSQVRAIAVNPIEGYLTIWNEMPQEIWG